MEGARKTGEGEPKADDSHFVSQVNDLGELVIPELEERISSLEESERRPWSPMEEEILRRYYRPGLPGIAQTIADYLTEHFPPGRSKTAIWSKAIRLGLTRSKG